MTFETIEIELPEDVLAALLLEAHRQGVSFDHYMNAVADAHLAKLRAGGLFDIDDEDDGA
jgi:hypothetical protein